ncbi:MAG TPA: prenyltransferase [Candidatus Limnocylindria bacterium]|nr:prenyltransferase [Candidatus Limnocylindria bacterium]
MNVGMWGRALITIQRVDRAAWQRLDIVSRWLIVARASVLVITFISVAIAGLLAIRAGRFDAPLWVLSALALLLAHATNNLLNDLTDHLKGVDKNNYFRAIYGPHALEHQLLSTRGLLAYAAFSGLIALAIGGYLVSVRGPLALALFAAGAFFVLFYTWPLKYIGLGEVAVLLVWGPLMIGGTYFVVSGVWDWDVALVGLPYALGATTVIFGKHIDKLEDDRARGIHTLPVLIGERAARWTIGAMIVLMYATVVYLVIIGFVSPVVLVVFFALPRARTALDLFSKPRPTERPEHWPAFVWPLYFVRAAFSHNRRFGLLLLVGLAGDVALRLLLR